MKKLYKNLPAAIFVLFIVAMMALFIVLPKKEYSSSEKRYLQQAPAFSFESLMSGQFGKDFEKFLSDQTAGRNFWVGLSAYYNYAVGNNGSNGVYKCKDNYLINDPEDMSGLMRNVGFIEEFAEKVDVKTTVLVAPSTGYVCENLLPENHKTYHDDEVFPQIKETLKSADFVDIRELFKEKYDGGLNDLYYHTDHHWTSLGAYYAYTALADELGFTPHAIEDYEVTVYPGFYGTTYSSSGYWMTPPDEIAVWDDHAYDDTKISVKITDGDKVIEQDGMYFYDHLSEDDKYPVYLDGNHPYTVIKNDHADSDKKLMIIKDSFAHSLAPFLADHYSEIIMIDLRYFTNPVSEIIKNEKIDETLIVYSIDNLATDTGVAWIG